MPENALGIAQLQLYKLQPKLKQRASDYEETVTLGCMREAVIRCDEETLQPPEPHWH